MPAIKVTCLVCQRHFGAVSIELRAPILILIDRVPNFEPVYLERSEVIRLKNVKIKKKDTKNLAKAGRLRQLSRCDR